MNYNQEMLNARSHILMNMYTQENHPIHPVPPISNLSNPFAADDQMDLLGEF